MARISKTERDGARETLRELLPPGTTVFTVLRHVSRSGMSRSIDAYLVTEHDGQPDHRWLSRLISKATGISFDERREALKMNGAGHGLRDHSRSRLHAVPGRVHVHRRWRRPARLPKQRSQQRGP